MLIHCYKSGCRVPNFELYDIIPAIERCTGTAFRPDHRCIPSLGIPTISSHACCQMGLRTSMDSRLFLKWP